MGKTNTGGTVLSERELAFIALYKDCYPRIHSYVRRRVATAHYAQLKRMFLSLALTQ